MKHKILISFLLTICFFIAVFPLSSQPSSEELYGLGAGETLTSVRNSVSSTPPPSEWNRTYGGAGIDRAYSLLQTTDGGFALLGFTQSSGAGGRDFWLVKTNASGVVEWNQTYGGASDETAWAGIQTSEGGYALAGETRSYGAGGVDFWLVKTYSNGTMQWNQTYGGTSDDSAYSLVMTSDGGYALAGTTSSSGAGGQDFWLVKTDSEGNMQWNQSYGGGSNDFSWDLVQTSDGGYALTGYTYSFGAGSNDFWLVKTDSAGQSQWNRTYGGTGLDIAFSLIQTSDGGYALAGDTISFGAGFYDFWLVKSNSTGEMEWSQTYGGTGTDVALSVTQTSDLGYALAGYTTSQGAGSYDFWLVNANSTGTMQWNQTFGGTSSDAAQSVIQTDDNGYALAGYTSSFGAGLEDFWLIKIRGETQINIPPVASFTESAETVYTGESISFNASDSYDPDGAITSYFWDFGDGANTTGVVVNHTYTDDGNYTVTLAVSDNRGAEDSADATKTVLNRGPVTSFTESAETVYTGESITFNASGSHDPDGLIVSYYWDFGDETNATGIFVEHAYTDNGTYTVTLTVTDDDGATDNATSTKTILSGATHDVAIVSVNLSKNIVGQGHLTLINVTVENQGEFTETFNVTLYANATIIQRQNISLADGHINTLTFIWNTTGFSKSNYTMSAYVTPVDGEVDKLDNSFTDGWIIIAMIGDITGPDGWPDGTCNMIDVATVARYFGQDSPPAPANYDVVYDGAIDMLDVSTVARHFGETDP